MKTIITAGIGAINWRDLLHGLYVAIGTAVSLPLLQWVSALEAGKLVSLDYKTIGLAALAAGIGYIVKKLFTPALAITPATTEQIASTK